MWPIPPDADRPPMEDHHEPMETNTIRIRQTNCWTQRLAPRSWPCLPNQRSSTQNQPHYSITSRAPPPNSSSETQCTRMTSSSNSQKSRSSSWWSACTRCVLVRASGSSRRRAGR
ncbi:hypothetical protein PENTCL1PPCAC_13789 [Pristionchus entomophagus]|uniref:Uncharacterized protein n=1 Tax=Pristionchus entomophagus TaxID=358040 RepID=A0AAV5TEV6_9BILA|nr:hypothetical protein PENTCL1PPCAC_13789 [Pristionchus entomophagus]